MKINFKKVYEKNDYGKQYRKKINFENKSH